MPKPVRDLRFYQPALHGADLKTHRWFALDLAIIGHHVPKEKSIPLSCLREGRAYEQKLD